MDKTFAHIQVRRDTEERWSRLDPDLLEGEWGFEVDTGKAKLGIGKSWSLTEYFGGDIDLSEYATKEELEGEKIDRVNADTLLQKQIAELREQFIKVISELDGIDGDQIEILLNGVVTLEQFTDLLERLEKEIAYRVQGDLDLWDGLKAEKEDRQQADRLIENHIARVSEKVDAIEIPESGAAYDDSELREKIEQEKAYRVEGDKALQEQIDSVVSYDDSLLRESLEQERAYRIEGDKQAAEDLAREIKRRENGDNDLQELIEREKAFRVQADQEQVEMITAEKSDRQQADQAIENHVAGVNDDSKKRDAALGQVVEGHKVDSVNADAYLQRQIAKLSEEFDKLIAGIDGIDGEEITVLLQSAASLEDLDAISEKIEKEIAYRVQGDQLLLEQLQALEARFDALKGYDDSDLREKLEAEKGYRVEEDQKLQEQIDGLETPDLDAVAKAGSVTDEFLSTGRRLNLDGHKLVGKDASTALSGDDGVAPGVEPGRLYFDGQRLLTEYDLTELEQEIAEAAKPVFYGPAPGPENPEDADLWYNTDSAELLISTGGDWALIGPTAGSGGGDYDDTELRALIDGKAEADHTHEATDIDLSGYALVDHQHEADDIDLSGYALVDHGHGEYLTKDDLSEHQPDSSLGGWSMVRSGTAGNGTREGFGQFCGRTGALADIDELTFHGENSLGVDHLEQFLGLVEGDLIQLRGEANVKDLEPTSLTFKVTEARELGPTQVRISGRIMVEATVGADGGLSNDVVPFAVSLPHGHSQYALVDHTHDFAEVDHDHDEAYASKDHTHPDVMSFEGKVAYHFTEESKLRINGTVWTIYKDPNSSAVGMWYNTTFDPPAVPGERIVWLKNWTDPGDDHHLYPNNWNLGKWYRADEIFGGSGADADSTVEEAPNDGKQYARQSEAWSEVVTPKLDGALIFKGAVDAKAQLPADPEVGHFYLVVDENTYYGWTGTEWDPAGSHVDIDLDGYVTVEQLGDLDNAPDDGEIYGRKNNQWAVVPTAALEDQIQELQERGAVVFYQEDPPENPENGALWYNTLKWELYIWHSTGWVYVNGGSGGGGGNANLHYGDTPPATTSNGMLWFKTDVWDLYVYHYNAWVVPNVQHYGLKEEAVQDVHTVAVIVQDDIPTNGRFGKPLQTGEMWFSTRTFSLHVWNVNAWMALT